MKYYTVKELSKLAGVSIKTLHLYDELGLLKPKFRTDVGYRYYTEKELFRLQQIIIYKELDFPLKEILKILDSSEFQLLEALENQKKLLESKEDKIHSMLKTINNTIKNLRSGKKMAHEEIYEGLPKEFSTEYRDESILKWGDSVSSSENYLKKLSKKDREELIQKMKSSWSLLFSLREEKIDSKKVQDEVKNFYQITIELWGKKDSSENLKQQFKGLGELYTLDERYTVFEGKPNSEFANFMKKAIEYFVEKN